MTPLEDDFCDIVRKARFGLRIDLAEAAERAGLGADRLTALEGGADPTEDEAERLAEALALRSGPLKAIGARRYAPPKVPLRFGEWTVTPYFAADVGAYCYGVSSEHARFSVDAGGGANELREAVGAPLQAVLLTHGHRDHVAALTAFSAPAHAHPDLAREAGGNPVADGQQILGLRAIYCPGHSADMVTFQGPGFAFVGDTLFAGSLGRARTPDDYEALLESARRILALPAETALFCGHGPPTTVAAERDHNAFPV